MKNMQHIWERVTAEAKGILPIARISGNVSLNRSTQSRIGLVCGYANTWTVVSRFHCRGLSTADMEPPSTSPRLRIHFAMLDICYLCPLVTAIHAVPRPFRTHSRCDVSGWSACRGARGVIDARHVRLRRLVLAGCLWCLITRSMKTNGARVLDRVFSHALNTVNKIRTGSQKPPSATRLKLYGLYKQAMGMAPIYCIRAICL